MAIIDHFANPFFCNTKMSKDSLAGLGAGLRSLYLEGNQLEEVPDLHPLTSLEVINLAENPLLCDCPLLPLRM